MENQTTNQKRNFHRRYNPNFNKPKAVSYLKSFDKFEDGFLEALKFNPELKNYCGDTPIYDSVISTMMETIKNDMPSPSNPNYPNTLSMSIDSGEVGFKTDINIAIGWRIAYNYHEAKSFYKFRITFISIPSYKKEVISDMEEAGWSKLDPNHRQKKYWDKVEGKSYKPNKKDYKRKEEVSESDKPDIKQDDKESAEENDVKNTFVNSESHTNDPEVTDENEKDSDGEVKALPKTHEEAVKFFAEKDMVHDNQWENPETNKIETIAESEIKKYIAEKKNSSVNSIVKAGVEGVFIVTHNGVSKVFNTNEPNAIPNVIVDTENGIIAFQDGIKFDTNNLTVIE